MRIIYNNILFNTFAYHAKNMSKIAINRLKVVLAEKNLTNKWLAEQLGKNEATISRWCTNEIQPPIKTFIQIAEKLNISERAVEDRISKALAQLRINLKDFLILFFLLLLYF